MFSPNAGGGGKSLIGRNTDNKGHGISADFAAAITRTNTRITKAQSQYPTIPLTEKLLSSNLQSVFFDPTNGLFAQVNVQNMLAQSASISLNSATS